MPDAIPAFYWDSCVFLDYIHQTPERLPVIEQLLLNARDGEVEIVTSVATIVEVAFATSEKSAAALDPTAEADIGSLWQADSPVRLAEFHQGIAEDARALMREGITQGWGRLQPYDAIHLATAQRLAVTEIHTYDTALGKFGPAVGCPVVEPHVAQTGMFPPP